MHSTLVVKDEVLKANPWLAPALFAAFQESKQRYVNRLLAGQSDGKNDKRYIKQMKVVGNDPSSDIALLIALAEVRTLHGA